MENGELCVILDLMILQLLLCADSLDIVLGLPPLEPPGVPLIILIALMISPNMCSTSCVFIYYSVMAVLLVLCG